MLPLIKEKTAKRNNKVLEAELSLVDPALRSNAEAHRLSPTLINMPPRGEAGEKERMWCLTRQKWKLKAHVHAFIDHPIAYISRTHGLKFWISFSMYNTLSKLYCILLQIIFPFKIPPHVFNLISSTWDAKTWGHLNRCVSSPVLMLPWPLWHGGDSASIY